MNIIHVNSIWMKHSSTYINCICIKGLIILLHFTSTMIQFWNHWHYTFALHYVFLLMPSYHVLCVSQSVLSVWHSFYVLCLTYNPNLPYFYVCNCGEWCIMLLMSVKSLSQKLNVNATLALQKCFVNYLKITSRI